MKPSITDYLRYGWQLLNGLRAAHEQAIAEQRLRDITPYLEANQPLQVLDVANGHLRPQTMLLSHTGHQVYGIDLVNRPQVGWKNMPYRLARWIYAWQVGLPAKNPNTHALICGDANTLPVPNNTFDMITSVAAFEHFLNVPRVVSEVHRVMRPGSLVWVLIHLFTSPSGGHNTSLFEIPLRSVPAGAAPWDHLRQRRLPFHVPLNEWRRDQYLEIFDRYFDLIKHYCAIREGNELLTPEIEAELSDYTRDELTCRAYVILARKG